MTIDEALRSGAETLANANIADPVRDASLLLRFALKSDAAFLYAHSDESIGAAEADVFNDAILRRAGGEPCQHITGKQEFFGLDLAVSSDVLIPRPETEILVEAVIREYRGNPGVRFVEIGAGSGCISIAILQHLPNAKAIAVDISARALDVAFANAETHGVKDRMDLRLSDIFEAVTERDIDFIVSNPPYVPEAELAALQREVKDFEPRIALSGGKDGLSVIRKIVQRSRSVLRENGQLFMEIGWDQEKTVAALLRNSGWTIETVIADLQGIPRIFVARSG